MRTHSQHQKRHTRKNKKKGATKYTQNVVIVRIITIYFASKTANNPKRWRSKNNHFSPIIDSIIQLKKKRSRRRLFLLSFVTFHLLLVLFSTISLKSVARFWPSLENCTRQIVVLYYEHYWLDNIATILLLFLFFFTEQAVLGIKRLHLYTLILRNYNSYFLLFLLLLFFLLIYE